MITSEVNSKRGVMHAIQINLPQDNNNDNNNNKRFIKLECIKIYNASRRKNI